MTEPLRTDAPSTPPARPGRWRRAIGYALLAVSTVTWFGGLLGAPFLPLSAARRVAVGGALVVVGEITFWAAVPFLGKEIVLLFRRYLNPLHWFRKKAPLAETEPETDGKL
ncbi:MAG: transporter suffix domain-containing protein [Myxococcales bacterium]|nr:transporter suffix domain-containing protein [Myxococcales bacterium]